MSENNIDTNAVIPLMVESEETPKKSLKEKVLAPIKKHPKIATAVGLGVALVAGAALFGKEDDLAVSENPTSGDDSDVEESDDSPSTDES